MPPVAAYLPFTIPFSWRTTCQAQRLLITIMTAFCSSVAAQVSWYREYRLTDVSLMTLKWNKTIVNIIGKLRLCFSCYDKQTCLQ